MVVRCHRVECIVPQERKQALLQAAIECQRMTNRLWQIWLVYHCGNGSAAKLREHCDAYAAWKDGGSNGPAPQWPVNVLEPPLTDSKLPTSFYRILSAEGCTLNARTRGLLTNAWQAKLRKRKAANGNLPGWMSILFAMESLPSFTRPQPIPFDYQNSQLQRDDAGRICVVLRAERDETTGKSIADILPLLLNKRKARQAGVVVNRILDGVYKWKGSSLLYDRGKWYVALSYELPEKSPEATLDPDKILYVRPARQLPWRLSVNGCGSWYYGGNGMHVTIARKKIEGERLSRQQGYRWAGSTRKGRGRKRAEAIWTKLSDRWKDFVKRYNREIAKRVVNIAIEKGCGRVVYLQPTGRVKMSRALSTLGATEYSRTSWDYFQMGTLLASKCEELGVAFGVGKKTPAKTAIGKSKKTGARKTAKTTNKNKGETGPPSQ